MLKTYKGYIFDMDGVLANTEPLHFIAESKTYDELSIKVSTKEQESFVGTSQKQLWQTVKENHNVDLSLDKIIDMHMKNLNQVLEENDLSCMPSVDELISMLIKNNVIVSVASSSPKKIVTMILKKIGLFEKFSTIVTADDVKISKPNPEIFLIACEKMGINPCEALVIEDSKNGVLASNAANIDCVGFINKNSGDQDLSKANFRIDHFEKLIDLYKNKQQTLIV